MDFGAILGHLANRGFATRVKWCRKYGTPDAGGEPESVLVFGMDNVPWVMNEKNVFQERNKQIWTPCLDDICASDWMCLPFYWNGSQDDFLPFGSTGICFSGCRGHAYFAFNSKTYEKIINP